MSASDQAYPAGPPRPGTTGGRPAGPAGATSGPAGGGVRPGQTPQRPAGTPQRPMTVPSRPAPAGAAPRTASPAPGVRPATAPTGAGRPPVTGPTGGSGPGGAAGRGPAGGPGQGPAGGGQSPSQPSAQARPAASAAVAKAPARPVQPRIVRLTLAKIDPWSALKLSFLLAVGIGIATVVAAFVVWNVVDKMGVFDRINEIVVDNFSSKNKPSTFDLYDYVGMGRVVSLATVIAVFNVLLLTALGTLMAALYNVSSSLVGGLKVTLSDE